MNDLVLLSRIICDKTFLTRLICSINLKCFNFNFLFLLSFTYICVCVCMCICKHFNFFNSLILFWIKKTLVKIFLIKKF